MLIHDNLKCGHLFNLGVLINPKAKLRVHYCIIQCLLFLSRTSGGKCDASGIFSLVHSLFNSSFTHIFLCLLSCLELVYSIASYLHSTMLNCGFQTVFSWSLFVFGRKSLLLLSDHQGSNK